MTNAGVDNAPEKGATVIALESAYLKAPMPRLFSQLKDCAQQASMPLLQALFDHVDDALFEMADKAESNAAQNMYFEAMREIRLKRRGMELAFLKALEEEFIGLLKEPLTESDSVSTLEVVSNDELDELMATDSLVNKAEQRYSELLAPLSSRVRALVQAQTANTATANPISPKKICQAFVTACQRLETETNVKLVLFKLFDRYVIDGLEPMYSRCNQLLSEAGINAELVVGDEVEHSTQASADAAANAFEQLRSLVAAVPQGKSVQGQGILAPGQAAQIPRESLLALLQLLQHRLVSGSVEQVEDQWDVVDHLNHLFLEQLPGQSASIGKLDDDIINLVAMLFQFVLEDRNLAAPIKALLAKMQIPIIKVAMKDKGFFSKAGHPARKLLNAMATSCLGWQEPANLERDPLYKKITNIVTTLLEDFEDDEHIFESILLDFNDFIALEKRRASLIEQRTLDAEDGKAKSEVAREAVKVLLQEKMHNKTMPPVVMSLLQDAWSNVLFLYYLKSGTESEEWLQGVAVVDELLWSVAPMQSPGDRKQLLKLIPQLLKNLRQGLSKVAFNPFEMNRLFDELENVHLEQLKQSLAQPVEPEETIETRGESQPPLKRLAFDDEPQEVEATSSSSAMTLDQALEQQRVPEQAAEVTEESFSEESLLAELDELDDLEGFGDEEVLQAVKDSEQNDIYLQRVDILAVGNWLEMLQDDGAPLRCRLAAIIRGTGKYIFVNRAGMKVAEHSRESLAAAIANGEVTLLDDGLLFDRALESVIGNLRDMKSGSRSS